MPSFHAHLSAAYDGELLLDWDASSVGDMQEVGADPADITYGQPSPLESVEDASRGNVAAIFDAGQFLNIQTTALGLWPDSGESRTVIFVVGGYDSPDEGVFQCAVSFSNHSATSNLCMISRARTASDAAIDELIFWAQDATDTRLGENDTSLPAWSQEWEGCGSVIHWVIERTASTTYTFRFYQDGVLVDTHEDVTYSPDMTHFSIGGITKASLQRPFHGAIGPVVIVDRAVTAREAMLDALAAYDWTPHVLTPENALVFTNIDTTNADASLNKYRYGTLSEPDGRWVIPIYMPQAGRICSSWIIPDERNEIIGDTSKLMVQQVSDGAAKAMLLGNNQTFGRNDEHGSLAIADPGDQTLVSEGFNVLRYSESRLTTNDVEIIGIQIYASLPEFGYVFDNCDGYSGPKAVLTPAGYIASCMAAAGSDERVSWSTSGESYDMDVAYTPSDYNHAGRAGMLLSGGGLLLVAAGHGDTMEAAYWSGGEVTGTPTDTYTITNGEDCKASYPQIVELASGNIFVAARSTNGGDSADDGFSGGYFIFDPTDGSSMSYKIYGESTQRFYVTSVQIQNISSTDYVMFLGNPRNKPARGYRSVTAYFINPATDQVYAPDGTLIGDATSGPVIDDDNIDDAIADGGIMIYDTSDFTFSGEDSEETGFYQSIFCPESNCAGFTELYDDSGIKMRGCGLMGHAYEHGSGSWSGSVPLEVFLFNAGSRHKIDTGLRPLALFTSASFSRGRYEETGDITIVVLYQTQRPGDNGYPGRLGPYPGGGWGGGNGLAVIKVTPDWTTLSNSTVEVVHQQEMRFEGCNISPIDGASGKHTFTLPIEDASHRSRQNMAPAVFDEQTQTVRYLTVGGTREVPPAPTVTTARPRTRRI